ncbi:MAG: hypothetical protein ACREOI_12700 [bacterium]
MSVQTQVLEDLVVKTGGNGGVLSKTRIQKEAVKASATRSLVKVTADELKAKIEARLQAAYQKSLSQARPEVVDPYPLWDLVALGPFQPGAVAGNFGNLNSSPFLAHQVIRVGETAYIATVIFAPILNTFCLPYEVEYCTGDLCEWTKGPEKLNVTQHGHLSPTSPFAVDILQFTAETEDVGCKYEMHICARIKCCDPEGNPQPPFAGFARHVYDYDAILQLPDLPAGLVDPLADPVPAAPSTSGAPDWQFDQPIRFMIYE